MKILTCENGHYLGRKTLFSFKGKFCPKCGAKVISKCPACGKPIRANIYIDDSEFCPECGVHYPWFEEIKVPLLFHLEKALEVERRLLT